MSPKGSSELLLLQQHTSFSWAASTLRWKFLVSLETQLHHMMLFCKLSCKRMFCWSRRVRRQSRCLGGCVMFGKNISRIWQTVKGHSCTATPCNASLVFTSCREMAQRTSHSILVDSCRVHWLMLIWLNLVVSAGWSSCCWIMLGVCYWTGLLVSWQRSWNHPKELLQNRFTTPFFYKPSFPPTSGWWAKREVEVF